nr:uncharacterized N-acetyltransferase YhfO-like [Nerophis lumbriciformis]
MHNINVTRATVADVERVAPLFDAYRQFYQQPPDLSGAGAFLRKRLSAAESTLLFAHNEAEVLGFTQLYPVFSSVRMRRELILNDLFVSSAARRQGVGKRLLDAAREYAREIGSQGLTLETSSDNLSAQQLYMAYGFEKDTEHFHYYFKVD